MKRAFVYVLAGLCAVFPALTSSAQSMSNDEETIRNAYAKFSFLCAVETVTKVAEDQHLGKKVDGKPVDQHYLDVLLEKTVPSFTLTNFETGPIASIANRPWGDFVTPKSSATMVLTSGTSARYYSDNGTQVIWRGAHASWSPAPKVDPTPEASMMARPVSKVIEIASHYWSGVPVTYTRYVAFTVDASLDGKSSGPHKALFLFGTDAKGKEFVSEQDLITDHAGVWQLLATPTYPAGFLQSPLRNTPAVAGWIRSNEMPASSCNATKRDVCCSNGRCGISQIDLNRDLATPLPSLKNGGNQ